MRKQAAAWLLDSDTYMLLLLPFAKAVRLSQVVCPFLCQFVIDQYAKFCDGGKFLVLKIFKSTHLLSRDGR
jgi:hypothetical protein